MSTFTKEQLISRINQVTAINKYRISRDPNADGLAMDNELFAIALASLEAEPVPEEIAATLIAAIEKEQDRLFGQDYLMDSKDCIDVIREEMERLNARCAAVLHDDEPSKMSGIMPDYEGGTLSQRELFQAGWEAHHAAMLQSGAPVQFGWSKGHFGYNALFNAISKAVSIQGSALSISVSAFEDAMLAAAPQQEVK
ncbi:hypothetical protein L7A00_001660 [Enterobacter cloacae]|nr:hypothetical protein [Enterobacter cloacae]EKX9062408.1 hypothetical protein [Enterobacter cloacae]